MTRANSDSLSRPAAARSSSRSAHRLSGSGCFPGRPMSLLTRSTNGPVRRERLTRGHPCVQGIGQALYEGVHYDGETGQLLTGSLLDYAIPRADVLPPIWSHLQGTPSPTNPLGV